MTNTFDSKHTEGLIEACKEIKESGWHLSTRTGSTGIGKTFEDLLKKEEDNHALPDFGDIEIKTRDKVSDSLVTLWTKSPSNPRGANSKILRKEYGKEEGLTKTLRVSVRGDRIGETNTYDYRFKIRIDRDEEKVVLEVYNLDCELIDDRIYWSFKDLQKQIDNKLKYIAIISAHSRDSVTNPGMKEYSYDNVQLFTGLTIEKVVDAIENGDMIVDIRLGAYSDGRPHDHGTAFRMSKKKLLKYADVTEIF